MVSGRKPTILIEGKSLRGIADRYGSGSVITTPRAPWIYGTESPGVRPRAKMKTNAGLNR